MGGDDMGEVPTELAPSVEPTEAVTAWSLADDDEDAEPARRLTPGRITALAVAASVIVTAAAAAVAIHALRDSQRTHVQEPQIAAPTPPPPAPPPRPAPSPAPSAQHPTTTTAAAAPPTPTAVALSTRRGSAFVRTRSGRTVCQVSAGNVSCNVDFVRPVPILDGLPATGVMVTAGGDWQWLVGDPGNPEYQVLDYGTIYRGLGWTITPTSEGTTFMHDVTGHGMTVSVEGFTPF